MLVFFDNAGLLLTAGRGLPATSYVSFASPKESNQRKGDPAIPEFPKSESAGRAAQKLGSLILIFKVSEPQTSAPLIRPADPDFGGAGRGKVKINALVIQHIALQGLTLSG